jgi:cell division septal protein FtsQ
MKFRYQNQSFKKNLDRARHYKRSARKIPQSGREIFFAKLGLDTWPSKVALVLVLGLLVYLTYIPNIFYVANVQVNGLKLEEREKVAAQVQSYFKNVTVFPQKNILFLSKSALKKALEKNNLFVNNVAEIQKDFPNSLLVSIVPRYAYYQTQNGINNYQISSDGIITSIGFAQEQNSLLKIEFSKAGDWVVGQKILTDNQALLTKEIIKNLAKLDGLKATKFYMDSENEQDLAVDTSAGYLIKFDLRTNWQDNENSLKALFTKIPANSNLAYIDLRVPERAYVCYQNTPCATQKIPEVAGNNTSTIQTLINNK